MVLAMIDTRILECEGDRMFYGIMLITPKDTPSTPSKIKGVWLYKPEDKCWYCNGWSYMEDICTIYKTNCICKRDL